MSGLLKAPVSRQLRARWSGAGLVVLAVLGGFFAWAALVPLSRGAVAPGTVVVDSKRKTIQHLEGGVIRAIHVKEGARVRQDEVLLELDDAKARAEHDVLRSRTLSRRAAVDRLQALMEGRPRLDFSPELQAAHGEREVAELLRMHQSLFSALRAEHEGKARIAQQRVGQLEQKLQGLQAYRDSSQARIELLGQEVRRLGALHDKRLVEASALAERQQQLAQQQAELGNTVASIAETRIAIGEAQLAHLQVEREWQQELSKQLSEAQEALLELRSQLQAAQNVLQRTVIRAPMAGVVLGLKATTVGGVLTPGSPVMDVVPEGDRLVIDAHVRPLDVDAVHQGMQTLVKLTSFKARTTPDLHGVIENVSADVLSDPNKGEPYYLLRVSVAAQELRKLQGVEVVPGMPAEVYANGGSRTLLQYLFDPLSAVVRKSLRED